ncbi:hypothetical protein H2200_012519 [Cladophialophora chaetospira]|uniref:Uncharacterized protein n=1 Tax=Cladophialophora chaetospira TaxID=386627 RepID=A0AA38WY02_9EURO|nr:hypothetical protein H2200_012519 [Cladophialophora chaetospira]
MSTESSSPQDKTRQQSPSTPQTPLTNHLIAVMDSQPVPAAVLGEMRQQVRDLPEIKTWSQLKQWFHMNRPAGAWTMGRLFDAQKAHHAQYLDDALAKWSDANSVHPEMPPRGTSSKKMEEMARKSWEGER